MNYIFSKNGKIIGSGQCRILNPDIECIEVSASLYQAYQENPDCYALVDDVPTLDEEKLLDKSKDLKLVEINSTCDAILNQAVSSYPESEVLTFDQQVEEVKAYQASGNPVDAPLVSALASARGITLEDLIQRVMAKRQAFSVLSGYVIGQRQALEDRLDECQTTDEVNAIVVDIKIPEAD